MTDSDELTKAVRGLINRQVAKNAKVNHLAPPLSQLVAAHELAIAAKVAGATAKRSRTVYVARARELGHSWDAIEDALGSENKWEIPTISWQCPLCHMKIHDRPGVVSQGHISGCQRG